jgi:hypothetical protein
LTAITYQDAILASYFHFDTHWEQIPAVGVVVVDVAVVIMLDVESAILSLTFPLPWSILLVLLVVLVVLLLMEISQVRSSSADSTSVPDVVAWGSPPRPCGR